ncbi:uncharacterized protein LOC105233888 isoform X11 [Bactrocera dorsalis]|uniref:Uncharacterized protein LOC105233888 isoform X11 n=1 Tax=Bactrocera dorsalis TaxID=27457 RepID=A0ABM3K437_BACDO|nr:uncharacterized protein LOC105233888 isoform X11 [Bactrocera dorsalis]
MNSALTLDEVKENVESNNAMEDLATEVEIEDCSDNSEDMDVELSTQNKIQATETETKLVGSEKQNGTEGIEAIDENNKEGDDHSVSINDLEETVIVRNRSEKDLEDTIEDRETTNASPKLISTATVPTVQQDDTECKSDGNVEIETIKNEIKGQDEIGFVVEGDEINISEDNIVENKEVKLGENAETAIALLSANSKDEVDKLQPGRQLKGESTNAPKHIDLLKIFTPATDANEIVPRNHSTATEQSYQEEFKENNASLNNATQSPTLNSPLNQMPLRFLMNPFGKVRDITSVSDSFNIETGLLSPNKCAELVTALQTQKGKGAELFAKRRRKSEKWVVDDTNTGIESPSGLPDYHQQQSQFKPAASPNILPAYSDAGKHRVQLNLHQEQVLEKYIKPGLKVVKTPWEAALETGSASTAFIDDVQHTQHAKTPTLSPIPVTNYKSSHHNTTNAVAYKNAFTADYSITPSHEQPQKYFPTVKPNFGHNPQRELAYKPSLAKGWKAPSPSLPKEDGGKVDDPNEYTYKITSYEEKVVTDSNKTKSLEFLDNFMASPSPIRNINLGIERQLQELYNGQEVESGKINSKSELINVIEQLKNLEHYNIQLIKEEKIDTKRLEEQQKLNRSLSELQDLKMKKKQENEYVKIAVRELISNYDQHLVNIDKIQESETLERELSSSLFRENRKVDDIPSKLRTHQLRNQNEELYLPKEISLESYAPPPVVTMKEPENFKSSRGFASTILTRTSTFPLAKPNPVEFRSYGQPNSSAQVQQETSQLVPQINYNPSPLPYDKIAKFENVCEQAQNNGYDPQFRRLSVKSDVDKIQNIPSTLFGEKSANGEWLTISPYIETPSPVYTKRINPNALLHGQNYNNTARGWKSSDAFSCKSPCDTSFKTPNLPYTDF